MFPRINYSIDSIHIIKIRRISLLVNIVFSRYYIEMETHQIYNYMERINNLLRTDSRQKIVEYGLQPIQLEALHYLSICNKYSDTPKAVTEYLGQTKGTTSQTLNVLEKKKYLIKQSDESDKRVTHLKVTSLGLEILEECIPTPKFINACEQLSENTQTEVTEALNKLLSSFIKTNDLQSFGVCHSCRFHQVNKDNDYFCGLVKESIPMGEITKICREHEAIS